MELGVLAYVLASICQTATCKIINTIYKLYLQFVNYNTNTNK